MNKIKQSEELIRFFDRNIEKIIITTDGRREIVGAYLDIALEHQKAIILLIAKKYYGTASSLMRVLFEAYVKSLWFNYCATDKEIEKFKTSKKRKTDAITKKLHIMSEEVNKKQPSRRILAIKKDCSTIMNSFTHNGYFPIERRFSGSSLKPNYSPEEIEKLIGFVNTTSLLCFTDMLNLSTNKKLNSKIMNETKKIMPHFFSKN